MKRALPFVILALLPMAALPDSAGMQAPDSALIELFRPRGLSFEALYQTDTRSIEKESDLIELRGQRIVAGFGVELLPFLALTANAGWSRVNLRGELADAGPTWGVALHASLYEYVLRTTPMRGRKERITVGLSGSHRQCESDLQGQRFEWQEGAIVPSITYTVDLEGPTRWTPYNPTGTSISGGVIFSQITGNHGEADLDEVRDFGYAAAIRARLHSGFVVKLDVKWYQEGDATTTATLGYYF